MKRRENGFVKFLYRIDQKKKNPWHDATGKYRKHNAGVQTQIWEDQRSVMPTPTVATGVVAKL